MMALKGFNMGYFANAVESGSYIIEVDVEEYFIRESTCKYIFNEYLCLSLGRLKEIAEELGIKVSKDFFNEEIIRSTGNIQRIMAVVLFDMCINAEMDAMSITMEVNRYIEVERLMDVERIIQLNHINDPDPPPEYL
jgi:hypothetical protein